MTSRSAARPAGARLERRWTVVAECGEGLRGADPGGGVARRRHPCRWQTRRGPNRRAAAHLRTVRAGLSHLAVRHEMTERGLSAARSTRGSMGGAFDALPTGGSAVHESAATPAPRARAGSSGAAASRRALAAAMRFPPEGRWPLHVAFAEARRSRALDPRLRRPSFRQRAQREGRAGRRALRPLRFAFDLPSGPEGLEMLLRGWSAVRHPAAAGARAADPRARMGGRGPLPFRRPTSLCRWSGRCRPLFRLARAGERLRSVTRRDAETQRGSRPSVAA